MSITTFSIRMKHIFESIGRIRTSNLSDFRRFFEVAFLFSPDSPFSALLMNSRTATAAEEIARE